DPADYAGLTIPGSGGPVPYVPPDEIRGLVGYAVEIASPIWSRASADAEARRSAVVIFDEAAEGIETDLELDLALRPASDVRVSAEAVYSRLTRKRDGSEFARTIIPRLRAEYQLTRSLFVRAIGEYRSERRDALRDPVSGVAMVEHGVPS